MEGNQERVSNALGSKVGLISKLNLISGIEIKGRNAYTTMSGLIKEAHKVIDQEYKANGGNVSIMPIVPLGIKVSIKVEIVKGYDGKSIREIIRSVVFKYVNNKGVGESLIDSEITQKIQEIQGVKSVRDLTVSPRHVGGEIKVNENEKLHIFNSQNDITVQR
jgi:uncharacterized phage protein gp47/JayE